MDETLDETRAAHSKDPSERTAADKILIMINERESDLRNFSRPDSYVSMAFEQAGTRQEAVNIVTEEIAALRDLDPNTVTPEQVSEIDTPYRERLDALYRG